jgi:hypothetical protein
MQLRVGSSTVAGRGHLYFRCIYAALKGVAVGIRNRVIADIVSVRT